ncbi:MAG: pilus assembly protein PilP [Gammaproteobacteria bacterium]|nr:pilus assembly protein PilP [Gammaproteobacteria bacterium]
MLSKRQVTTRALCLVLMALLLQGCVGSEMADLKRFVATAHKDKKPEIEPLPEIPPFKAFEYSDDYEVDPFSSSNIISSEDRGLGNGNIANRPQADRRKEPLENFPLDALRFVGTITKDSLSHVVVKTNEGTAMLATIGNYMGQNDGRIKEIVPEEQRVLLVETVLDPTGRWITRDVVITIDE